MDNYRNLPCTEFTYFFLNSGLPTGARRISGKVFFFFFHMQVILKSFPVFLIHNSTPGMLGKLEESEADFLSTEVTLNNSPKRSFF